MNEEITFPLHFLNFKIMNIIAILNRSNEIISNEIIKILSNLERLSTVILCCNNKTENLKNLNEIENNFKNEDEKKTYFTVSQTK